jgi:hypothetical protein
LQARTRGAAAVVEVDVDSPSDLQHAAPSPPPSTSSIFLFLLPLEGFPPAKHAHSPQQLPPLVARRRARVCVLRVSSLSFCVVRTGKGEFARGVCASTSTSPSTSTTTTQPRPAPWKFTSSRDDHSRFVDVSELCSLLPGPATHTHTQRPFRLCSVSCWFPLSLSVCVYSWPSR